MGYLDSNGLSRLWTKIKSTFISGVSVNGASLTPDTNGNVSIYCPVEDIASFGIPSSDEGDINGIELYLNDGVNPGWSRFVTLDSTGTYANVFVPALLPSATQTVKGAMSAFDKKKLDGIPNVSASDNGKVMRVVNGKWSAVALPSASGVSF